MKNFDLYAKHRTLKLDPKLFRNPTAEYRGCPFWSWNNKLDREQLHRQIDYFREMGIGGVNIHCRTGLATEYLGDEFMDIVKLCTKWAKERKMLVWLYDEDRWPSGSAGGLVTKDHQYRCRHLIWTCKPYGTGEKVVFHESFATGSRSENGRLIARYSVELEHGFLKSYRRLKEGESATNVWYAYLEVAADSTWYNNQAYVDTLNPAAIRRFVEMTHERYKQYVGDEFGKTIPAIFTDEPQFAHKTTFHTADDKRDLIVPFTDDLPDTYRKAYGDDLLAKLPELFWELPDRQASLTRYRYHDHVAERFASAFADVVGGWCEKNGIALTGHMMEEANLHSQTHALGEAMRSYRSFQLPGIDMLCDWHEYTTAKQTQSAVHQYGRSGMLSELYGVTDWDFDFVGYKAQGDWQAALGVTIRVHHLSWVSMAGEAKRDYPASIFYQSPWYKEYSLIEDHFARLYTVLTRGKPGVRVGVLHPIESYWLCWGPVEQTRIERIERETNFRNLTNWLLHGLIDFNFVCESLLPSQSSPSAKFTVGQMNYDAVVVPPMHTIRSTTLDRLEAFANAGGKVVFAGEIPSLVDAQPSDRAQQLAARCTQIVFNHAQLLAELDAYRDVEVPFADSLIYQLRIDGDARHLFLCNTDRIRGRDATIRFRGQWKPTLLDTMTGKTEPVAVQYEDGWTVVTRKLEAHGHVLLTYLPGKADAVQLAKPPVKLVETARLTDPVRVTLSEPNALMLDQAEWRLNEGAWQPREEILRIDNLVRERVGLRPRRGEIAQPWVDTQPKPVLGEVELRFTIESDIPVRKPKLAMEAPENAQIALNGKAVPSKVTGYFVDEAVKTVPLPDLKRGTNKLTIRIPFHRKTDLEWCYVLGDFGVKLSGRHARIIAPVRSLTFGDWATQGLPFYTGNVTYHCRLQGNGKPLTLEFAWLRQVKRHYANEADNSFGVLQTKIPLVSVQLDGKLAGKVAFAPFRLALGRVKSGNHRLDLTVYGHRFNAFGCVHNLNHEFLWSLSGPGGWRTEGRDWSYEYQLKPMGLAVAPIVLAGRAPTTS